MERRPVDGRPVENLRRTGTWTLLGLCFVLDLLLPREMAASICYALPVLLSSRWGPSLRPLVIASVASGLCIAGLFIDSWQAKPALDLADAANVTLALLAVWSAAVFGVLALQREELTLDRKLKLRTLVEATPDLIVSVDGAGLIETANPAAARAFGASAEELVGRDLARLLRSPLTSTDGSIVADAVALIADGRTGSGLALQGSDGQSRTIRWTVRPLDDQGHRLAVGHDLTDLLAAQDRAVQSERLAAIGQTLATLSHEAKNELLGLRFGLEQLSRSWDDHDAAADLIAEMLQAQGRLWTLFEDVRGFAAPIRLKLSSVFLPDVWRHAWRSVVANGSGRLFLREDFDADAAHVTIDAFRIEQVFRNLFENSLAACGETARVEVSYRCGSWRGEPALFVEVRDNGPGIPDGARDRLFEPFFTTKPHGTGLGLPLCRRVVEAHHGELTLLTDGPGAAFQMILPSVTCGSAHGTAGADTPQVSIAYSLEC